MDTLAAILSSRSKAEIFRLLFGAMLNELHLREIARRTGFNVAALQQELKRLTKLGLVEARRDSNRVYFRANKLHPLFVDIRSMVLKTVGLVEVLRDALKTLNIRVAFVFGSLADTTEEEHSDIDLMVVGRCGLRKISHQLGSDVSRLVGREINPIALTPEEFQRRLKENDHFISTVMRKPKLFVIGEVHELEAMAVKQLAETAPVIAARGSKSRADRRARPGRRKE